MSVLPAGGGGGGGGGGQQWRAELSNIQFHFSVAPISTSE